MKVIQSLGWYFPDSVGGTEVYVHDLVHELQSLDINSTVFAPINGENEKRYEHQETEVFRYPIHKNFTKSQLHGETTHGGFNHFVEAVSKHSAEIYHQHSWTTGCGLQHLKAAKRAGKKTIITIHVPGIICLRGTMMQDGIKACDGFIETTKCSGCWGSSRGLNSTLSRILGRIPVGISRKLVSLPGPSKISSALGMSNHVYRKRFHLLEMANEADKVIAVCQWLYDALLLNGIPKNKLVLSRQGLARDFNQQTQQINAEKKHDILRIGFVGRYDPVKGIHMLVNAIQKIPNSIKVELHIYAMHQAGAVSANYRQEITKMAGSDERIIFHPPVNHEDVSNTLAKLDILAVPSQWLETGPLVVLESFAMGVPVIGSNIGGISELVENGVNGLLLSPFNSDEWTDAIMMLIKDRNQVLKLETGIKQVRRMEEIALDMVNLYQDLS